MEKVQNGWEVLGKSIKSPPLSDLDVDCVAVGIASVNGPAVHFEQLLFLQGEIHEEPETLQSQCASLVALWAAVRAPSLIDLGKCTCIGRRLFLQEPTLGRRFAIDATPISDNHLLFAVISSTKRWSEVETVKAAVAVLVRQANELHSSKAPIYVAPPNHENEELDWYQFTARELEILKLVASGISNKQIARELGSSPNTVRNQIHALFRKAKVTNRTELALRVTAAI
ncbi:helix-turn-helix transcriptional regulator [Pseudomonas soli]|uniref:helix-turn-helix transcriptional regulator n=1 Tax=Pseudomonas soli TaxID=1306993 RepID=UPI0003C788A3|nr:hypothetical protein O165_023120 [Pseudomonas soli]